MDFQRQRFYYNISTERVRVTVRSVSCAPKTLEAQAVLTEILQNMAQDPRLMYCDDQMFDSMRTNHDGTQWVIIMEAIVQKKEFQI